MKITFLNIRSHPTEVFTVYPPVGILSMSACLKKAGYSTSFIDADIFNLTPDQVVKELSDAHPNVLGITLNVAQVAYASAYIAQIQDAFPQLPIVLGGPYVTGVQDKIFSDFPSIQFAIVSEGEYAIIDLVEFFSGKRKLDQVRNLLYHLDQVISSNPVERIQDIDALPLPDYDLVLDHIHLYRGPHPSIASPSIAVMCTRGCPFDCTFCSSPLTWNRRITFRSVDSIIRELHYLRETIGVKEVFFQDDTMNARPLWFTELCDKIIANQLHKDIFFKCPFRVDKNLLTPELLSKARQANFWMIFYGVESGNQKLLDKMKKNTRLEDIVRAFALTRKAGIASFASLMIGNDGETRRTVKDSMKLVKKIMPDYGGFAMAAPFPGSELHRIALEKGHISEADFTKYQFGDCILRTDELSIEEIIELAKKANAYMQKIKGSFRYKLATRYSNFLRRG